MNSSVLVSTGLSNTFRAIARRSGFGGARGVNPRQLTGPRHGSASLGRLRPLLTTVALTALFSSTVTFAQKPATALATTTGAAHQSNPAGLINDCRLPDRDLTRPLQSLPVVQHTLANGLRVVLLSDHRYPIFALRLVYGVGARDEAPGQSGYAHLFEHLMFKGTDKVKDGGYMAEVAQAGGSANASTDYDSTEYFAEFPSAYLDRALWLEADRMQHLKLTPKKLANQLQAVREEKASRFTNQPYFKPVARYIMAKWHGTPYGHILIGSDADLATANLASMQHWLKQHYNPNNAVLALVGDFDSQAALARIKHYFGSIPKGRRRAALKDQHPLFKPETKTLTDPMAPWPAHGFAWSTPGASNPDAPVIALINQWLLSSPDGPIYKALVEDQQLAFMATHIGFQFDKIGLANVLVVPRSYASRNRIQAAVDAQLNKLRHQGIPGPALCALVKSRLMQQIGNSNRPVELARMLADGWLFEHDPRYYLSLDARYRALTTAQTRQIAMRYFTRNYLLFTVEPKWTIRSIKTLLEWLPDGLGKRIEESQL